MIIYYNAPEIWLVTDVRFFSFWAIFVPFSPLIAKKIKTIKNKENTWRYQDFTQVYHKSNHMIDDSFDMKRNRQKFFVILGHFLPFYPNKNPKNQSFEKMKKNYWRYHHFTQVHQKLYNVPMLYNVPEIWRLTDVIFIFHFGLFYPILPP